MFERFKVNRIMDQVVHELALAKISHVISEFDKTEQNFEISDNNSFFEELPFFQQQPLSLKRLPDSDILLLHNLSHHNIVKLIPNIKVNKALIILFHNSWSLDNLLSRVASLLGLAADESDRFHSLDSIKYLLEKNHLMIISDQGSFFAPKLLLIFLPNALQSKLRPILIWLDKHLSLTIFKSIMRNRIVVAVPYYNNTAEKLTIDSKYAQLSLGFDQLYNKTSPQGKTYFRNVLKLMKLMNVGRADSVLDIGIGTGTYSIESAKRGAKVTGFDISEQMLALARKKITSLKLNISLVQGDAEKLPFKEKSYSKIVTASVPHDVNNFEQFISEMSRVLKDNGQIFMNIYNPFSIAGIVTRIEIILGMHPPIRTLPLAYVKKVASRSNLELEKIQGIELFQGIPIPWSWKWWLTEKFDNAENKLSLSRFYPLFSQYILVLRKKV